MLYTAGDISGVITTAVSGLSTELLTVAAAGVGLGATIFGVKKAWSFFKGTAR